MCQQNHRISFNLLPVNLERKTASRHNVLLFLLCHTVARALLITVRSRSSCSPVSLDVSSTLYAAKELLPFLWTVAKGFVHTAKSSTAPAESNELKEITEVFVGPYVRAEEAALTGQQWGQLNPAHLRDEGDDEEIQPYKSNQSNGKVTGGVGEVKVPKDDRNNHTITTIIYDVQQRQKQQRQQQQKQRGISFSRLTYIEDASSPLYITPRTCFHFFGQ